MLELGFQNVPLTNAMLQSLEHQSQLLSTYTNSCQQKQPMLPLNTHTSATKIGFPNVTFPIITDLELRCLANTNIPFPFISINLHLPLQGRFDVGVKKTTAAAQAANTAADPPQGAHGSDQLMQQAAPLPDDNQTDKTLAMPDNPLFAHTELV